MKVLVCGGRSFDDLPLFDRRMDELHQRFKFTAVVHGGAPGADTMASFWAGFNRGAVLKRGLIGVYHHASAKHLPRYVDEFSFRLNEGNVKHHTMTRLDSFVGGAKGKRLTYKALIA